MNFTAVAYFIRNCCNKKTLATNYELLIRRNVLRRYRLKASYEARPRTLTFCEVRMCISTGSSTYSFWLQRYCGSEKTLETRFAQSNATEFSNVTFDWNRIVLWIDDGKNRQLRVTCDNDFTEKAIKSMRRTSNRWLMIITDIGDNLAWHGDIEKEEHAHWKCKHNSSVNSLFRVKATQLK